MTRKRSRHGNASTRPSPYVVGISLRVCNAATADGAMSAAYGLTGPRPDVRNEMSARDAAKLH
jgi:hypothetical protein